MQLGSAVHFYLARLLEAQLGFVRDNTQSWLDEQTQSHLDDTHFTIDATAKALAERAYANLDVEDGNWATLWSGGDPASSLSPDVPMVEFGSDMLVTEGVRFKFVVDWVARDGSGNIWVIDHKVRATLTEEDGADFLQLPLYQKALEEMGFPVSGTAVFQILSQEPREPQLNQNGAMSRALIRTDWPTYQKALAERGLDETDYQDMREKLEGNRWFNMVKTYRLPNNYQRVWDNLLVPTVKEIMREDKQILRNRCGVVCRRCAYRPVCDAELFDDDVSFIVGTHYKLDERKREGAVGGL